MRKVLAVLVLAGCAAGPGPSDAPAVVAQSRAGVTLPAAMGETRLVVRAVSSADGQEIAGAQCQAQSRYSAGRFAAPGQLLLPDFGSASPEVTVRCAAGDLEGAATSVPRATLSSGLGVWPAVGVSVGTGSSSGVGVGVGLSGFGYGGSAGRAVVTYPPLDVVLK